MVVLLGDGSAREKLEYIDTELYPGRWEGLWSGFLCPLMIAVVFVFLSPFLRRWVTVFIRSRERETLTQILQIEGETPLTKAQADMLRQSIQTERERRLREREEANRHLDELRQQLDLAASQVATQSTQRPIVDEVSNPLVPAESDTMALLETDFVGVSQNTYLRAAQRGLTRSQGELLYVLRNGNALTLADISKAMHYAEHHPSKVLIDQLKGLGMIDIRSTSRGLAYEITSGGTQALAAVINRGFNAEASLARRAAT